MLGLAFGQLIAGSASDRFGRRGPLMVGVTAYILASALCALAPSIGVLLVLRLIQGLAGSAGIVIAQAVGRDLYSRREDLVRLYSGLVMASGLAAIVGPVLGGQLARFMSWRGIFAVLAALGAGILLAGILGLPETLPAGRRTGGGLTATVRGFSRLLRDRLFTGAALASGLANASVFAYLAGATFVLQKIYGLSPQGYSFAVASISLGFVAMGHAGGRLARRWPAPRQFAAGLALNLAGAACVCAVVLDRLPLGLLIGSLFVMVSAVALIGPPASALALAEYAEQAGAASSLLGLCRYVCGALAAPLVGIAGERAAAPLGIVALSVSACAVVIFLVVVLPRAPGAHRGHPTAVSA